MNNLKSFSKISFWTTIIIILISYYFLGKREWILFMLSLLLLGEIAVRSIIKLFPNSKTIQNIRAIYSFYINNELTEIKAASNNILLFEYNPFVNFVPRPSFQFSKKHEINQYGFRGPEIMIQKNRTFGIYMAGDCTIFESHLKYEQTFCCFVEKWLNNHKMDNSLHFVVYNAGGPHYTTLHVLNRFIIDSNRLNYNMAFFESGINDVLVFLHSGKVLDPSYSPPYISGSTTTLRRSIERWPRFLLKNSYLAIVLSLLPYSSYMTWEANIFKKMKNYRTDENLENTKKVFHTRFYEFYLRSFFTLCKMQKLTVLSGTSVYFPPDMKTPFRNFYTYGIDRMNKALKRIANEERIQTFDYSQEFELVSGHIKNKWHFTEDGNRRRAELVGERILNLLKE